MVLKFYELEFHQKISSKFECYFFKELKFMELEFPKLEYPKNGKSLHISETVVN